MKTNEIQFEVLEDGTITVTTGDLAGPNHVSADKLLKQMFELAGGQATSRKRTRLEVGHDMTAAFHEHTHDNHQHLYVNLSQSLAAVRFQRLQVGTVVS